MHIFPVTRSQTCFHWKLVQLCSSIQNIPPSQKEHSFGQLGQSSSPLSLYRGPKTLPRLWLCASSRERRPHSLLGLTPSICLVEAGIYKTFTTRFLAAPLTRFDFHITAATKTKPQQTSSSSPSHPARRRGGTPSPNILPPSPSARGGRPPFDFVLFNLREPGL